MDIRSLISKLENIDSLNRATVAEAEDPAAVITKYQEMGKNPTPDMPAFIDPKDGKVKYMDRGNDMTGLPQTKIMPSDWIQRYAPDLAAALAAQGGNQKGYGAQQKGGLFGIKGLGNFDQGTTVNTKQAAGDADFNKTVGPKLQQIKDLTAKLNAEGGGNTDPTVGKVDYSLGGGQGINFKSAGQADLMQVNNPEYVARRAAALQKPGAVVGRASVPESTSSMKLEESILREFGYDIEEGGITLGADGKVDPNGHTPEKQMALNKMVGDNMNAAAGKGAIVKQLQALLDDPAISGIEDDPEITPIKMAAYDAIKKATPASTVATKPATDASVPGKPDSAKPATDVTAAASASGEVVGKSLQRFKDLLAKASAPAGDAAKNPVGTTNAATAIPTGGLENPANRVKETTTYFLEKLRLLESIQVTEALTDAEKKELDTLAQSYGDSEDPEIMGLLKQYGDVKNSALNATPGAKPTATTATKKKTLAPEDPKVKELQKAILAIDPKALPKYGADGRMGGETQMAMKNPKFKAAVDKFNSGTTATKPSTDTPAKKDGEWGSAKDWGSAIGGGLGAAVAGGLGGAIGPAGVIGGGVLGHEVGRNLGGKAGEYLGGVGDKIGKSFDAAKSAWNGEPTTATKPSTTATKPTASTAAKPTASTTATKPATTTSNQSVSGTLKMGKADGPITYNGKTVNPGDPEYATAEQALIRAQGESQQARTRQPNNPALASTPVQQGASQQKDIDFESVVREDNAILAMIRGIKV